MDEESAEEEALEDDGDEESLEDEDGLDDWVVDGFEVGSDVVLVVDSAQLSGIKTESNAKESALSRLA